MSYFRSRLLILSLGLVPLSGYGLDQSTSQAAPRSATRGGATNHITATQKTNFQSKEGAFSIYFPAKPKQTRTAKEPRYMCRMGSVTYAVDSSPISPPAKKDWLNESSMMKKTFDRVQGRLIKGMNGKLQTSRDVVLQGVPGRQYTASATIKGVHFLCTMHMYVSPKSSYLVMAMGSTKDCRAQRTHIERFLGSFRPTT